MRFDQVGWVELFGTVLALIATGFIIAAVGAGALNISIRQKTTVGNGINLFLGDFADQSVFVQFAGEVLGQPVVLRAGRPPEMVETQSEAARNLGLDGMHLGAIISNGLSGLCGGELGRGAMFVSGAQKQHFEPASTQVACVKVGRQLRPHQIAQVFDPVDVGDSRCDQVTGHQWRLWIRFDEALAQGCHHDQSVSASVVSLISATPKQSPHRE